MQKDFYRVTELTKEIQDDSANLAERMNDGQEWTVNERQEWHLRLLSNQMSIQLAIAQQLTMCAQGLKTIADLVQSEANKSSK